MTWIISRLCNGKKIAITGKTGKRDFKKFPIKAQESVQKALPMAGGRDDQLLRR